MGKYITLSKNKYIKQSQSRYRFKKQRQKTIGLGFRLGNISLGFLNIVLIGVLGLSYISLINSVAVAGYAIKDADQKIGDLKRVNRELELELASLKSVSKIKGESERLRMVELSDTSYVNPNNAVAISKNSLGN